MEEINKSSKLNSDERVMIIRPGAQPEFVPLQLSNEGEYVCTGMKLRELNAGEMFIGISPGSKPKVIYGSSSGNSGELKPDWEKEAKVKVEDWFTNRFWSSWQSTAGIEKEVFELISHFVKPLQQQIKSFQELLGVKIEKIDALCKQLDHKDNFIERYRNEIHEHYKSELAERCSEIAALKEENEILESLMRSGEQRGHDKAEEHYKSEIAALKEENERLKKQKP